jgi:hypothetical protein
MITISLITLLVVLFLALGIAGMVSMKFGAHFGTKQRPILWIILIPGGILMLGVLLITSPIMLWKKIFPKKVK